MEVKGVEGGGERVEVKGMKGGCERGGGWR